MPTIVSHGIIALVAGEIFNQSKSTKFWLLSMLCVILPDIDVVLLILGVPQWNFFDHRGFTHSILFVLLTAFIIMFIGFREIKSFSKKWWIFTGFFFFLGLSHIILDAMTSGGQGVGFFMPFNSERYLFSFRPIRVSPFRLMRFFGSEGKRILVSEAFWIWLPAALTLVIIRFVRIHRGKK